MAACQAGAFANGRPLAIASEPMRRGHQERLAGMVGEVLNAATLEAAKIDRIAVTVGPGSFTGLRVGLAFAKGLGLALGREVAGVGTLAALAASIRLSGAAVIDAGRGRLYLQICDNGRVVAAPEALCLQDAAKRVNAACAARPTLVGPGAPLLAGLLDAIVRTDAAPSLAAVADIGSATPHLPAAPIYLRGAEATPPSRLASGVA